MQMSSELVKGIGPAEFPQLLGYVCTTPKSRAEIPLVTQKGDPLLAHWQFGLGRAVAWTSDAKGKWAADWLGWEKYRQFWLQVAQWSLRRVDAADFTTEVAVDKGEGHISVEAIDARGNYRNFLNLETVVVSPKGETQIVPLEQTGPGHYEAKFPTKEVGAYLMNLLDRGTGPVAGAGLERELFAGVRRRGTEPEPAAPAGRIGRRKSAEPGRRQSVSARPAKDLSTAGFAGLAAGIRHFAVSL